MHIGLIGGIGPAATDYYYRRLITAFAGRKSALELTIVHADAPTLLTNLGRAGKTAQAEIFTRLTNRLASAGANCVAVTSIAGHFCREPFQAASPLPVIDLIAEVGEAVRERGFKRIGILGTRTVMESRFYGSIPTAEIIPPAGEDLERVHEAYIAVGVSGTVTDAQRAVLESAARRLLEDQAAEAIMLGGTDLAVVFDERTCKFPLIDCAGIHCDGIVRFAARPT